MPELRSDGNRRNACAHHGQNQPAESSSGSTWSTSNTYKTGTTTSVDYAYDQDGKPLYAYIAGELSGCYSSSAKLSRLERRMLTVYDTENPDVPMYFFVFDAGKMSSSTYKDYKRTFLLHTPTEPTISGSTVTVESGDGKLVLQNVTDDSITRKGQYSVDSGNKLTSEDDGMWGRVEISTSGSQESYMLNAMYVTDASKSPSLTATKISGTGYNGVQMGKVVAVFMNSASRVSSSVTFTSTGSGDVNYYVSGVTAGTWNISVGGKTYMATASEDGGILSFTAPAGSVTITHK